jgi:hypothetical protein
VGLEHTREPEAVIARLVAKHDALVAGPCSHLGEKTHEIAGRELVDAGPVTIGPEDRYDPSLLAKFDGDIDHRFGRAKECHFESHGHSPCECRDGDGRGCLSPELIVSF